jgi:hypothetical protein
MGQQQMIILLLVVIVTTVAISVGFTMFRDNAAATNRDAIANDLLALGAQAQVFQAKPASLGGGDGSMLGFALSGTPSNANGNFDVVSTTSTGVMIEGIGVEMGYDGVNPVKILVRVSRDSMKVVEIN